MAQIEECHLRQGEGTPNMDRGDPPNMPPGDPQNDPR